MDKDSTQAEDPNLYKALLDNGIDLVTMINANGLILYMSPTVTATLGYPPDELEGRNIFAYVHPEDVPVAVKAIGELFEGAETDRLTLRVEDNLRQWCKLEVVGRPYDYKAEPCIILNIRDVRPAEAVLEKLRTSERLLQAAFNSTSSLCTITNLETGEFIDVNDAWTKTTGWSKKEAIGRTALELKIWDTAEGRRQLTDQLLSDRVVRHFPTSYRIRSGEARSLIIDAEIVVIDGTNMMFLSGNDITDSERVEAQLRQAQRLEAVGQLTGGIAHDLNNMLTVILGQIDLSLRRTDDAISIEDALTIMRRATERGSELIRQLMIFSRRQTLKPRLINIATTINNLRRLLEGSLGGEVNIKMNMAKDTWDSYLDEALLESGILNLAINSRDAMPRGGELSLATENITIGAATAEKYEILEGDYVRFTIEDSGSGMDEATLAKVFEPFFTTKSMDQGSGLGLSMVFGFVKESGGHIKIRSEAGEGTQVEIVVPRAEGDKAKPKVPAMEGSTLKGISVLVIEDSDELRRVIGQLLKSFGCTVQLCNGIAPIEIIDRIDLILSDVMLPGKRQGPAVAEQLLIKHPHAKVIYMSGYPKERLTDEIKIDEPVLKKPFSREELQVRLIKTLGFTQRHNESQSQDDSS
ncbi:MAG: two-component system cell cycle sensor histidine kinase/response regulator CckA [Candidatus Azotimanducaceae bacterium]|jgi:two-component system cell cycle sensor histidine kinase/response regulator CckA